MLRPQIALKCVMYATDFSHASEHAFPLAALLARRYSASLLLVHVIPEQVRSDDFGFGPPASFRDRQSSEGQLRALQASSLLTDVDTTTLIIEGAFPESLDDVIKNYRVDLAVVGSSAVRGFRRLFLGSGAERIYRHTSCPVMVVGPNATFFESRSAFTFVLVPIDFSTSSLAALPYAEYLAQGGRIVLLHAVSSVDPRLEAEAISNCTQRLRAVVPIAARSRVGIPTLDVAEPRLDCITEAGDPEEIILKHARLPGAGLIVMGVHHPGQIHAQPPWSTVRSVIREAQCPVLVVKSPVR